MIQEKEYLNLYYNKLIPLDIKFNVDEFRKTMEKYKYAFRRWGVAHLDKRRYGLPLVNENGDLFNNPEPVCYPLDQWNKDLPLEEKKGDVHFKCFTPVMDETCFDVLNEIKPYMVRSCILKWYDNSLFLPHSDTRIPSRIIRLWGTDNPEKVKIRFAKNNLRSIPVDVVKKEFELENHDVNIEPGRLYLMDTNIIHDAQSYANETYQFFFALTPESYDTVANLRLT